MAEKKKETRPPGAIYAITNTGPLISAFQCDGFSLVTGMFDLVYVTKGCVAELEHHGWAEEVRVASELITVELTTTEQKQAEALAERIAKHSFTKDRVAEKHRGEAEAITVALRPEFQEDILLLDELAARKVAKQQGLRLSGFPGVLLAAAVAGTISAEEMKQRLKTCRDKGTHYSTSFIDEVYDMAKLNRRI